MTTENTDHFVPVYLDRLFQLTNDELEILNFRQHWSYDETGISLWETPGMGNVRCDSKKSKL